MQYQKMQDQLTGQKMAELENDGPSRTGLYFDDHRAPRCFWNSGYRPDGGWLTQSDGYEWRTKGGPSVAEQGPRTCPSIQATP